MYENPFAGGDDEAEDSMDVDPAPASHTASASASAGAAGVEGDGEGAGASGVAGSAGKGPRVDRGDNYVLHFYDLAARKPHSLYQFVKA